MFTRGETKKTDKNAQKYKTFSSLYIKNSHPWPVSFSDLSK